VRCSELAYHWPSYVTALVVWQCSDARLRHTSLVIRERVV
jgi:hypothetical protein